MPVDVAILQVAPPDARGYVNLGISVDLAPSVLAAARLVIAEVNPAMPRTHGDSIVHISRFHALVDAPGPLAEYVHPATGPVGAAVARYIAALIEDGSTLQVGLGRIPNEAMRHLLDRRDLGVHSDVVTDSVLDLIEAGVVTGRHKALQPGRVGTSYAIGTRRLYDTVDGNPGFAFLPIDQVCDPVLVAQQPRMVSMTQAFSVDLTGQVCVDHHDGQFYGGVSTQAGFLRGAARSPGGKPIICLAAASENAERSNIVAALGPTDGVGVARSDVHFVVTDFGSAYLFGKSIRERAVAMIEIAHPAHRDGLLEAAKQLGYLPRAQPLRSQVAYPVEEERTVTLRNGTDVLVRPARAADAPGLRDLFHSLSDDDRYTRFFRRLRALPFEDLQRLCNVDHATSVAFLAVTGPRENEQVVANACYFVDPSTNPRRDRLHGRPYLAGNRPRQRPPGPAAVLRRRSRPARLHRGDTDPQRPHAPPRPRRPRHHQPTHRRRRGPPHHPV